MPGLSRGNDAGALQVTARPPNEVEVALEPQAIRSFSIAFPDPRTEGKCSHPGMDDEYFLDVSVDSRDAGVRVTTSVSLGAL